MPRGSLTSIREARDASPFKPFVVRTADGREFEVPNHDSLFVAKQGRMVIVVTADDKFHILAADLVSNISR